MKASEITIGMTVVRARGDWAHVGRVGRIIEINEDMSRVRVMWLEDGPTKYRTAKDFVRTWISIDVIEDERIPWDIVYVDKKDKYGIPYQATKYVRI